jgi:hypothetical protein
LYHVILLANLTQRVIWVFAITWCPLSIIYSQFNFLLAYLNETLMEWCLEGPLQKIILFSSDKKHISHRHSCFRIEMYEKKTHLIWNYYQIFNQTLQKLWFSTWKVCKRIIRSHKSTKDKRVEQWTTIHFTQNMVSNTNPIYSSLCYNMTKNMATFRITSP